MSLEIIINDKIKEAMRAKDKQKLEALRAIKNAILQEKTKAEATALDSVGEMNLLRKLVKQREDSAVIYNQQARADLAEPELFEAAVIREFLPAPLSHEEIVQEVDSIISESGATSMKDMGKVMGLANQRMAGRADGKEISDIVKSRLQ